MGLHCATCAIAKSHEVSSKRSASYASLFANKGDRNVGSKVKDVINGLNRSWDEMMGLILLEEK